MSDKKSDPKILKITWQDIHFDTAVMKRLAAEKGWLDNCRGVITMTRGGLVPTGIFCNMTGIKMVDTLCITSYDGKEQGDVEVLKRALFDRDGEDCLIIDDLVDRGKSMDTAKVMYPKAKRLCLYAKPEGEKTTDMYVRKISQDTWIYFPWELDVEGNPLEG